MNKKIEIFEPGMCCPSGLCGPSVDLEILRISTVVKMLEKNNVDIKRYNLISNTSEFISNKVINDMIKEKGEQVLPVTIVDGKVEKQGVYPTNDDFTKWTGISVEQSMPKIRRGCCGGGGCC